MEWLADNPRALFGEELKMLISYKIKKHKDNKSFVTGLKRGLSVIEDCCKTGMFEKYYIRYLCHHLQDNLDCLLIKVKPGMVSPKQTDWNEYNKGIFCCKSIVHGTKKAFIKKYGENV